MARRMDCFAALAMTGDAPPRHCEERSDEAIHAAGGTLWSASPSARNDGVCARDDGRMKE